MVWGDSGGLFDIGCSLLGENESVWCVCLVLEVAEGLTLRGHPDSMSAFSIWHSLRITTDEKSVYEDLCFDPS